MYSVVVFIIEKYIIPAVQNIIPGIYNNIVLASKNKTKCRASRDNGHVTQTRSFSLGFQSLENAHSFAQNPLCCCWYR